MSQNQEGIRNFGQSRYTIEAPNLVELQTKSYSEFLQINLPSSKRKDIGLIDDLTQPSFRLLNEF